MAHFLLTTLWDSLDAIKQFAGEDHAVARYYPEDDDYLLERELYVTHAEVLLMDDCRSVIPSRAGSSPGGSPPAPSGTPSAAPGPACSSCRGQRRHRLGHLVAEVEGVRRVELRVAALHLLEQLERVGAAEVHRPLMTWISPRSANRR